MEPDTDPIMIMGHHTSQIPALVISLLQTYLLIRFVVSTAVWCGDKGAGVGVRMGMACLMSGYTPAFLKPKSDIFSS